MTSALSKQAAIMACLVDHLHTGPTTIIQVQREMGLAPNKSPTVTRHLKSLRARGRAFICDYSPNGHPRWAWNDPPWSKQDAERPPRSRKKYKPRPKALPKLTQVSMPDRPASVFSLGAL